MHLIHLTNSTKLQNNIFLFFCSWCGVENGVEWVGIKSMRPGFGNRKWESLSEVMCGKSEGVSTEV